MDDLNDTIIKQAKATAAASRTMIEIGDGACKGLRLRASYGGAVAWYLLYNPRGERKTKRVLVGKYPTVGISEARRRALVLRDEIADGADPAERKRTEAAAKQDRIA